MIYIRLRLTAGVLAAAACLTFAGCGQHRSEDDESPGASRTATVAVKVAEIVERDAVLTVEAFGKTDALRKERVFSPIAGRILSFRANEGTHLRKGDLIATIQTKESHAAVLGAETMLRTAVTPEQKAEAGHTLQLVKSGETSINVLAKRDGVVATRSVSEGELVVENAELVTVIDLSSIDFLADVLLKDLPLVHAGQRAAIRFTAMEKGDFPAILEAISPQTDIQSQTVKVRLAFPASANSLLLHTDMIGTARIITGSRPRALFVPKTALLRNDEDNTWSVVTLTPDSLACHIPVVIGVVTDSTAELRQSGLSAGSVVITEGHYALPDSTRVTLLHVNWR
jgi:membrane fusion protein (multidrug efflux system)